MPGDGSGEPKDAPLAQGEAAGDEAAVSEGGGQGKRALVVDDNFPFRSLVVAVLRTRGFTVDGVEDAKEALGCLQEKCYDLILLDIKMPGLSGFDLCRMIRRQLGLVRVPIVAYTADGLGTTPEAARAAGFDDVLIKPLVAARLDQILAVYLPDLPG